MSWWYQELMVARMIADERVSGRRREGVRLTLGRRDALKGVRSLVATVMSWLF